MKSITNGHDKHATSDGEAHHTRFPLSNFPPQAGERANESLRELLVKCLWLAPLFLLVFTQPAYAFYTWQDDQSTVELRGLFRETGVVLSNPDNTQFYDRKNISAMAQSARLMLDASQDRLSFELHAEQSYVPLELQTGGARFASLLGVERSDLLDWSFDNKQAHLILDRLNVQLSTEHMNIKVGRQPINLAATFYFTPNDFFAPFAAQTFFRTYKSGVDAARADIQLNELSQLSLLAVLGYNNAASDNGWSNTPDSARNSYLARASTTLGDFELALLGGILKKDVVLGGDFQGELFHWLGVNGEGHVLQPDSVLLSRTTEFALGLEHRFANTLNVRLEQFYHGSGAASIATYNLAAPKSKGYLSKNYSALGASYEFTPLLNGEATTIYNWLDHSALIALNTRYSFSNESELTFSGTHPIGSGPQGSLVQSEFGLYADSINFEYRMNF